YTALALESLGRASLGEGALEWTVGDARRLPVLDPRRLPSDQLAVVYGAFEILATRPIGPIDGERTHRDRRALDRAVATIAGDVHVIDDAIWDGLIDSVARRHSKACS
ncbi:MAG: hypothetical protein KJO07_08440, partial [Deltaproteobacteria bacterium]|nr:hypothetical protein [Deltaproteobacteria bacterium]